MKVLHYPRVSSKKQVREGDSIEAQNRSLDKHSVEAGDEVVKLITDAGKSASITDDSIRIDVVGSEFRVGLDFKKRPGFEWAIKNAHTGKYEGIKFTKWDRFSRNPVFSKIAQLHFERNKIKLIPIADSTDPLLIEIKGALSAEEIRKLTGRVRDTRQLRFEKGIMVARPPFGYRLDKVKKEMKIDTAKARIVRDIFEMTAKGATYKVVCEKHKLGAQSYYNIIRNKAYIGIIEFEGEEKKGIHEPIITHEIYRKCQQKH